MQPSPGRIVLYTLSSHDAAAVNKQRRDFHEGRGADQATGFVGHIGNHADEGDVYPAIVVRVWEDSTVTCNLRVLLDGTDLYWATSREQGEGPSRWAWPERV